MKSPKRELLPRHVFFAHLPGQRPVRCKTKPLPTRLDRDALATARADLARRIGRPRIEVARELAQRQREIYGGGLQPPAARGDGDGWY